MGGEGGTYEGEDEFEEAEGEGDDAGDDHFGGCLWRWRWLIIL